MCKINHSTLQFLLDISQNNNKPWFERNRPTYEAAKENYTEFIAKLVAGIAALDPIPVKEPAKYISRIYRDIRFSKDKSPYKNNFSSVIDRAAADKKCPFYIQITPGNSFIGGGVWQPEPALLKKVRQEIDYNSSELHKIISANDFVNNFGTVGGESLVNPPKGFEKDNPNIQLLKLKQYVIFRHFDDDVVTSDLFLPQLISTCEAALPFFSFFDIIKSEI